MGRREVGRLVEEQLMDCHSPERARRLAAGPLVLANELRQADRRCWTTPFSSLLGVADPCQRDELINRLYEATARHFREIRVVEITKMEQRSKADNKRFRLDDLAADIWDAAELKDATPLAEWLAEQPESDSMAILLDERPATLSNDTMFLPNTVYFGKGRKGHIDCRSRGQAELVVRLADLGVQGQVKLPAGLAPCLKVLERANRRVAGARARFKELAESRTGDQRVQNQLVDVLQHWFVVGRGTGRPARQQEPTRPRRKARSETEGWKPAPSLFRDLTKFVARRAVWLPLAENGGPSRQRRLKGDLGKIVDFGVPGGYVTTTGNVAGTRRMPYAACWSGEYRRRHTACGLLRGRGN